MKSITDTRLYGVYMYATGLANSAFLVLLRTLTSGVALPCVALPPVPTTTDRSHASRLAAHYNEQDVKRKVFVNSAHISHIYKTLIQYPDKKDNVAKPPNSGTMSIQLLVTVLTCTY